MTKKKSIVKVNRPPLTNKAFHAIEKYVQLKAGVHILYVCIKLSLEADRMPREDLYAWLERKGYRWKQGYWLKTEKQKTIKQPPLDS